MKKILLLILISVFFSSCMTQIELPKPTAYAGIFDYSPLTSKGVFVTESNSVSFDYETIGSLYAQSRGGWINKKYSSPSIQALYNEVLAELGKMKANGIVNLKLSISGSGTSEMLSLTGMAIRKLDRGDINATPTTVKRIIGDIDGISLVVVEAYESGTKILTSAQMSIAQINKAKKKFFATQNQVFFYTSDGLKTNTPYMAIQDNHIINYATNEFIPLK